MIIYKITNLINGKCYIGQTTKSLEQRFKEHSKETIEYLRKLSTGKKQSKETKLKMSLAQIGEKNHFYGKKHNEKTKKILSETRKKYVGVKHPRAKPVLCIETGVIYPYIRKAQMETSISESHISSCCNGKLKTSGGYHWKYAKECEENA